jgi:MFS family permease
MLFSIWGGSVADRHPKRQIVLFTQTALMVFAFAFAALVWSGQIRIWEILVLAALAGLAMAFDMPARQAFMVEMTSRDDLINAISLNSSIVNGARVIGPAVAGLLMAQVGLAWCFFLNGLSFLAVLAGLWLMRLPRFVAPARATSAWEHIADGFVYVWQHQRLRTILLLFAVVGIFGWSYSVLMPAFAQDVLHVKQAQYGMLLSANGIGALLGALTVASVGNRVNRRRLVLGGLWLFSAMLLVLALVHNYYVALLCLAIGGWGMLLFFATINTLLQTAASDEMRGRVMGIWALVFGGMTPIGGLEAGTLSHYLGVRWAVAIGAVVCALAALVVWLKVKQRPLQSAAREPAQ